MSLINKVVESEKKIHDMQAGVRWYIDTDGHFIDYEWAHKNGMEYRETHNNNIWTETEEGVPVWPIEILSYDGEKQFTYTSTSDKSIQNGGIYGLSLIPFEASLMPRTLMGYSLLDTLGDRLKKAEIVSCIEQGSTVQGSVCTVIEARNIPIDENCIQHYKVWIDTNRSYRPLKIEIYRDTNPHNPWEYLSRRIENISLEEIDGIWFPVSGDIQYYRESYTLIDDGRDVKSLSLKEQNEVFGSLTEEQIGQIIQKKNAKRGPVQHIEISNIKLNQDVPNEKFRIIFPNGCAVWDDFLQLGYTVGPEKI